jgi:thymidylate kinase
MTSDTIAVAETIGVVDAALTERALIFGSPPPHGRDLDLLVSPSDVDAVGAALAAEGFVCAGDEWYRLRRSHSSAVEVVSSAKWRLPPAELDDLLQSATTYGSARNVVIPTPAHTVLILARKLRAGGRLGPHQLERLTAAERADPLAWRRAAERADLWGVGEALERLRRLHVDGVGKRTRRRLARTRLITISGIDGAGKTSQVACLDAALSAVGFRTVTVWAPAYELPLGFLANTVRRLLGAGSRGRGAAEVPDYRPSTYPGIVAHGWVAVQAFAVAASLWRAMLPHLSRGRVVLFDRHTLDYAVFMRYRHGGRGRTFRVQLWLLRALSPRPLQSYLLDVSGEAAIGRKRDHYSRAELDRQAGIYREEARSFRACILSGEDGKDDLSERIAADAWRALNARRGAARATTAWTVDPG